MGVVTITLPGTQGATDSYLKNDGSGNLSWVPSTWSQFGSTIDSGFTSANTAWLYSVQHHKF